MKTKTGFAKCSVARFSIKSTARKRSTCTRFVMYGLGESIVAPNRVFHLKVIYVGLYHNPLNLKILMFMRLMNEDNVYGIDT